MKNAVRRFHILRRKPHAKTIPRSLSWIRLGVLLFSVLIGVFYTRAGAPARVYAAVPETLNFQARLLNSAGAIVPDGNYSIAFNLYNVSSGGTSQWNETQSVAVKSGYLSVYLGSVNQTLDTLDWSQQYWLTMNVNSDGEMSPRLKLTSVPYAFRSGQADSLTNGSGTLTADNLAQLGPSSLQTVNLALAALRINQTGSGALLQLQGDGTDVFTLDKSGNGYFRGSLDIDVALTAGGGNAFSVNSSGDITSLFTALDGTSTTNGAALVASTSLTLNNAANFNVGNYVQVNSANCGGAGINPCYAKITAKVTNTLTITPALTWANGSTVNEYHVPEIGGQNTSQALANRYGRGYFIAGVATGNGTTFYNEGDITTSLDTFDLLNSGVTTLNIGSGATTINLGGAGTNLILPGTFSVQGANLTIGTATQQGSLILQNGDSKTATIQAGTLSANRTYTLPDVSGTICLTTTCTGGGGGPVDAFIKDGNSFGVTAVLGTNDNYGLAFETNGTQRMLIDTNGRIGIGTSGSPSQLLSIGGTTGNLTVDSSGALVAANLTSNGALSVLSGGASITGGLNNNGGGITNTGSITGVGSDITAVSGLTIASGGSGDLTLNSASGLVVLGAGTLQTADNLLFNLSKATDTTLSLQNSGSGIANLNLVDGDLQTGGTLRMTNGGILQNITGLTVSSGTAAFNGNVTIGDTTSDRVTFSSHLLGANALVFQGSTDDSFATTLAITDPTANNTITLPNASGTLLLDNRSIATGTGLTGGGNLSVDRTISLDIVGVTTKTYVNPNDYILVHDETTSAIRKITRNDFLQGLIGALIYRGTWDASTNTPTLADGTGTQGDMYVVSVAGTENFGQGPNITFGVGDFVIYNGTVWERAPSSADVTSVFGRTGAVTAQAGDYTASLITSTATGNVSSTNVQGAINELAAEKLGSLNGLIAVTQTFANDTNVTITSSGSTHTLGWSGQLSVARGGTGAASFTTNGVLYGNNTGSLQVTAAGTSGQILVANASGVPGFVSVSGDATLSAAGVLTIGADKVALGTDTTGNYLASLGTLTGLTVGGTNGVEGGIPTLAVNYGSAANTAVQGNTTITLTAGTNLSGGGTITLGSGGSVTLNTIASPTFTTVTASTLTSSAGLTISSGGTGDITLDSASNKIIIAGTDTTMERTGSGSYTLDLKDNAATSLVLSNSGTGVANLNLSEGALQIGGTTVIGSDRTLQNLAGITNVGIFTSSGGTITLNDASNFATNINTGTSNGTVTIGGGSSPLVINSTAFDVSSAGALSGITTIGMSGAITAATATNTINGLIINAGALSGVTTINASGVVTLTAGTNALSLTSLPTNTATNSLLRLGNAIAGGNSAANGGTWIGINAPNGGAGSNADFINFENNGTSRFRIDAAGLTTITGGMAVSGAAINLNTNSNFATNINTGTSSGTVTIGGGSSPLVIDSTAFDVSSAGALSGITTIGMSGAITAATATNTINGLIINAGALTGVTGITFSSGNTITSSNNANLTLNAAGTGSLVLAGYNCSTQSNGGALTTNASGVVACSADDSGISDARLKTDVANLDDNILDRIKEVRTVNFNFDCDQEFFKQRVLDCLTTRQTGVIAQELAQVFPELVYQHEDGYYRVKYDALNIYTLKAVGELAKKTEMISPTGSNEVITNGQLRLSADGALQNITGLSLVSGGASITGGINNNGGGLTHAGTIAGATTIEAKTIHINAPAEGNPLMLTKNGQGVFTVLNTGALELKLDAEYAFAVKGGQGNNFFSVNTSGGLVSIGSSEPDAEAVLLVLDSINMEGDPKGVNGAQYYNSSSNKFRCFQDGRWQDCLSAAATTEYVLSSQIQTWAQPAVEVEMPGESRTWVDLTNAREIRLTAQVMTAGVSGAQCRLQYAANDDGPWHDLSDQSGANLLLGTAGSLKTEWAVIKRDARKEILVRIICKGGNYNEEISTGAIPKFGSVKMQVR